MNILTLCLKPFFLRVGMAARGLLMTLPLASLPGSAQSVSPEASLQQTLLMGTEADYVPFEYRAPSERSSEFIGFDIDVANYIAQRLGFTLQIQELAFDQLFSALQSGELDFAIAAITPTADR